MQVAMILSDLKSLSVCGHEEALNLVNVHKDTSGSIEDNHANLDPVSEAALPDDKGNSDTDLKRAKDLVELHYEVKLKYLEEGLDADLQRARNDVKRVYTKLTVQKHA